MIARKLASPAIAATVCLLALAALTTAQQPAADPAAEQAATQPEASATAPPATETDSGETDPKLIRLSKSDAVWVDQKNKRVIVEGEVVLTEGQLEMFACPKGTKEHESVIAVDSRAFVVHTGLLAVGARSGHPVRFDPIFQLPTGDVIEVTVQWTDAEGKQHSLRGQEMVRHVKSEKAMQDDWVFGGSGFWKDEESGKERYLAEGGELICVSNFPTATMDLQLKSSQSNDSLLFEAFTENIPPRGTKVKLILSPRKAAAQAEKPAAPPIDRTPPEKSE